MAMMDMIPLDARTKPMVLSIMNGQYADAMRMYVTHFGKKADVARAQLVDLNEQEFMLKYTDKAGTEGDITLPFVNASGQKEKVATVGACRRTFVEMARTASEALGEEIALPPPEQRQAPSQEEQERQETELMNLMQQMSMMGEARGGDAAGRAKPSGPQTGVRTLHDSSSSSGAGGNPMEMMMAALAAKGKGKGKGKGKPEPESQMFTGEGHSLGSSDAAPATQLGDKEALSKVVREVDTSKPTLKLRVRLLDRKAVELEVNSDFTVQDLRTYLEVHHAASFTRAYTLMDGAGFPPKKLADMAATMEQLGLTKAGSSVECRPA